MSTTVTVPVEQLQPLVTNGWSAEAVVMDRELVTYANTKNQNRKGDKAFAFCPNCDNRMSLGDDVILMRDREGKRRAVVCTAACQRQYRLAGIGYRVAARGK